MDGKQFLTSYTIYYRPADAPDAPYLVRAWRLGPDGAQPMPWVQVAPTLEEARALIPATSDVCFPRNEEDDPAIVETWL